MPTFTNGVQQPPPPLDDPGLILRRRMREVGLSQAALGQAIRKSQGWVSQYLFGDPEATLKRLWVNDTDTLAQLARCLEWSVDELVQQTGIAIPTQSSVEQGPPVARIEPVRIPAFDVGSLAAGLRGYEQQETPDRYMAFHPAEVPRGVPAEKLFMIRVGGDSMYEENMTRPIPEGAWIMVERTNVAVDGQIVVAYIPDMDVAVVKQITRDEKSRNYLLRSYKIGGPTFWAQEHPDIRIQGVVRRLVYEF